jgi:ATP-dependent RNA helicase DeaD
VMAKVKRGEVRFMVATDIAARGIDISDLSHVVNYSLPEDPAVYLHRVGRTGRIGKKGTALSLATGAEGITMGILQKKFGISFEEKQMPTAEDARRLWTDRHVHELKEAASTSIFEGFIPLAQELKARPDGDHLLAFALKYFFSHHHIEKVQDLVKAEHKKEEHVRREQRDDGKRERRHDEGPGRTGRDARGGRGERGDRGDRGERGGRSRREGQVVVVEVQGAAEPAAVGEPAEPSESRPSRGRIFLGVGELDGADEGKVREAVAVLVPGLDLLAVELRRTHCFLEVKPEDLDRAVAGLNGKDVAGKAALAEKARRRRR